ncbi:hypothetical protein AAG906_015375 [Vitis piasezkii]
MVEDQLGKKVNGYLKDKVLITTHNQQIASDAHAHWMPFLKKTFPTASTSPVVCLVEFEGMGNEIIKKCKGLPLAIVHGWKSKSRPQLMLGNCCFEL